MKTRSNKFLRVTASTLMIVSTLVFAGPLHAQAPEGPDTTSSTTNDSTGKVTAVSADQTISVTSRRGPFTYRLSEDIHVIGTNSKPMKVDRIHRGSIVTVYYYWRDGRATAARIVVLKENETK